MIRVTTPALLETPSGATRLTEDRMYTREVAEHRREDLIAGAYFPYEHLDAGRPEPMRIRVRRVRAEDTAS
jgi:hypothetical protein